MKVFVWTDGGVRTGGVKGQTGGKSGIGSYAYVIRDADNKVIEKGGGFLEETTVNEAEFSAVICALAACARLGATDVTIHSDSQLVVMQTNKVWAIRTPSLRPYVEEVWADSEQFESVTFEWIPRHKNSMADEITREIISEYHEAQEAAA